MTRELLIQKVLGVCIVALAITFFSPLQIALLFIIFGQGHFLGAYYYQWKAGKMTTRWLMLFCALVVVLFALAIMTRALDWFILATSILFFFHHFQDEVTLFGKNRSLFRSLEQLPPILFYSAFVVVPFFGSTFALSLVILAFTLLVLYVGAIALGAYRPDALSAYLLLIAGVLCALWLSGIAIPSKTLLGAIILFHYVCWYVHFYYRFASNPVRQKQYIWDMLSIHVVVFMAYGLFVYTAWGNMIFGYFFLPLYFFVWTIVHIVFSIRPSDYRSSLRW